MAQNKRAIFSNKYCREKWSAILYNENKSTFYFIPTVAL